MGHDLYQALESPIFPLKSVSHYKARFEAGPTTRMSRSENILGFFAQDGATCLTAWGESIYWAPMPRQSSLLIHGFVPGSALAAACLPRDFNVNPSGATQTRSTREANDRLPAVRLLFLVVDK